MPAGAEHLEQPTKHLEQPTEHLEQPTIEAEESDAVQWLPDLEGLVRSIAKHGSVADPVKAGYWLGKVP